MSFSNPKKENPCTKFIEFKGDSGNFVYWDRDKEENVSLDMPLYFIVLDELTTISGYCKALDSGIYSNEVHNTTEEVLRVKSFKGNLSIVGKYADIKNEIKAEGGKYCKSVYAALITGKDSIELVNFKFKGASFSSWLDKKVNTQKKGIIIKELEEGKNGNTVYKFPVFGPLNIPEEIYQQCVDMDINLQEYLSYYTDIQNQKQEEKSEVTVVNEMYNEESQINPVVEENTGIDQNDDLPF